MTDPNSLADDILKVRQLISSLGNQPSGLLKDFYLLLCRLVAQEERFLISRGELLTKS
jgi:hypothetical protein